MLVPMKTLILVSAVCVTLSLTACGECRPAPTHAERGAAHHAAAGEAEKSFTAENPADPDLLK
jgi:hypothetical protein